MLKTNSIDQFYGIFMDVWHLFFPRCPRFFHSSRRSSRCQSKFSPHRWWHLHIAILSVAPRSLLLYPFRSVPDLRMTMLSGGPPPRYPSPSLPPFPPPPPPPPVVVDPHQSRVDFMCSFQFFTLHFPLLLLFCCFADQRENSGKGCKCPSFPPPRISISSRHFPLARAFGQLVSDCFSTLWQRCCDNEKWTMENGKSELNGNE